MVVQVQFLASTYPGGDLGCHMVDLVEVQEGEGVAVVAEARAHLTRSSSRWVLTEKPTVSQMTAMIVLPSPLPQLV